MFKLLASVAWQLPHTTAFMSDQTRLMNQMDADILTGRRLEELVMTCWRRVEASVYRPLPPWRSLSSGSVVFCQLLEGKILSTETSSCWAINSRIVFARKPFRCHEKLHVMNISNYH